MEEIGAYIDGEELTGAQLAKKLTKATQVLLATKKVDPFYLEMFKPGTIQLVLPASLIYQSAQPPGASGAGFF